MVLRKNRFWINHSFRAPGVESSPAGEGEALRGDADIGSPFNGAELERAGFEVLAFDVDDGGPGRDAAHVLEWETGAEAMLLDDLFAR